MQHEQLAVLDPMATPLPAGAWTSSASKFCWGTWAYQEQGQKKRLHYLWATYRLLLNFALCLGLLLRVPSVNGAEKQKSSGGTAG